MMDTDLSARTLALLIAALGNAGLAAFIRYRYRDQRLLRYFAACVAGVAGFSVFTAGLAAATGQNQAVAWIRATAFLSYATVFGFYTFAMIFSRYEERPWTRRLLVLALVLAAGDCLGRLVGWIPVNLVHHPTQGWFPWPDKTYFLVYVPVMLTLVLAALYMLVSRWRQSRSPLEQTQLSYVFLAIAAAVLLTLANLRPNVAFIAAFAPVVFTTVVAYGITRHRLLEIRLLFRQGLVASAVSVVLAFVVALSILVERQAWGGDEASGIFAALMSALVFTLVYQPLWRISRRWMDHWLGIQVWDASAKLLEFSLLSGVNPRLEDFLQATAEKLAQDLALERCLILLPDRLGRLAVFAMEPLDPLAVGEGLELDSELARHLLQDTQGLDLDSLAWTQRYERGKAEDVGPRAGVEAECRELLQALHCQALFGLRRSGRMVGLMAIGAPVSGRGLSADEQAFFSALSSQLAVVVENAMLHGRVQHADRLSSLGTLAAGLAHELRNPLSSISIFVQMLPDRFHDPVFREKFDRLVPQELNKLTRLTEQLLDIARPTSRAPEVVDLGALAERNRQLMAYQYKKKQVRLDVKVEGGCLFRGVEEELSQVLLNLLLNALDASFAEGWVELKVFHDGDWVVAEVQDFGQGMTAEQRRRLFEPFFTTKEQGTGLGLATSARIVAAIGGRIDVETAAGRGSRFRVALPMAQEKAERSALEGFK